jgi:hypothetical protein
MKTIKQAAFEYAESTDKALAEYVSEDFTASVAFVQCWISVGAGIAGRRRLLPYPD